MTTILMSTDTLGGVWQYSLQLAAALSTDAHIHLATMGAPLTDPQRQAAAACPNLTLHESAYKLEWMDDPWADVSAAGQWLLDLEQKLHPDIIHLNGYAHAALPFAAPKLVVAHSCVLSWHQACRGEPAPASWNAYRRHVAAGLHAADLVVAPSHAMLNAVIANYGPLANAQVIYNARSNATFRPASKVRFIFSAGRVWDEAKNIALLDQIAPDLPWPVYVAGDNAHPNGTSTSTPNVQFIGRLAERALASWLALSPIYVLPARYEPFGLSALEAGLSGCALVLGDIPSLREIWADAALFVPPDNPAALRDTLNNLIADPALRARYAARAHLHARQYAPQRMANAYNHAYAQLVNPTAAPAHPQAHAAARSSHVG